MCFVILIVILIDTIVILIMQKWTEVKIYIYINVVQFIFYLIHLFIIIEILAKNNPKLHERPRGGRSFQRIDSL